jgi:hypothetical protein
MISTSDTIQRVVQELQDKKKEEMKAGLAVHTAKAQRVTLTMDAWTAGNQIPYHRVTA